MDLLWYHWIALGALGISLTACAAHFIRLLKLGSPKDLSLPKGKSGPGVRYAYTGAMSPARKESAYLHLPTYTAGLIYHSGTFLSLVLFFIITAGWIPSRWLAAVIMALL